jgi:hypothetical protein
MAKQLKFDFSRERIHVKLRVVLSFCLLYRCSINNEGGLGTGYIILLPLLNDVRYPF